MKKIFVPSFTAHYRPQHGMKKPRSDVDELVMDENTVKVWEYFLLFPQQQFDSQEAWLCPTFNPGPEMDKFP